MWPSAGQQPQSCCLLLQRLCKKMEGKRQCVCQSAVCSLLMQRGGGGASLARKAPGQPRGLVSAALPVKDYSLSASLRRNTRAYGSPATIKLPLAFSRLIRLYLLMVSLKKWPAQMPYMSISISCGQNSFRDPLQAAKCEASWCKESLAGRQAAWGWKEGGGKYRMHKLWNTRALMWGPAWVVKR